MASELITASLAALTVPISGLQPIEKNVRKHSDADLSAIAASLERFGQLKPIVVRNGIVIAGNGTFMAARKLGWKQIAAVDASKLTDDEAKAYGIADNRVAELSEWDLDTLIEDLGALPTEVASSLGFADDEITDILNSKRAPFTTVRVSIDDLKAHPKNYQEHPEDQLEQIVHSIKLHGFYRNVVIAKDNTVLAGHGVVIAAKKMGRKYVPVIRLPIDPNDPRALKVLTSDNEIGDLAERDDRALTELLKSILDSGEGLEGTGFNEDSLKMLGMITTPAQRGEAANEWIGMPDFDQNVDGSFRRLVVHFRSQEDLDAFSKLIGQTFTETTRFIWYPEMERDMVAGLRWKSKSDEPS
jgi:ParB-like chromosome segregation protein Spo0J